MLGVVARLAAGCALFCAGLACAQVPAWTLGALIDELKRGNPQLAQARQAYAAARLQVPQAESLPAPSFSLLEQANTGGPFDFNRNSGFFAYPTLNQPFLWFGKRGLAGDIARAQAEVVGRQYDSLLIQLIAQLKLGCYQLMALQDQLRFMDEDLERLKQIKEVARVRYANNAAAYVDFLNAQVAASSLENDRYALQRQIQAGKEQINGLLGRGSQTELELSDADRSPHLPSRPLPELIELGQKTNPLIAGGASQVEAADRSVDLAHKAFWPDYTLSVGGYTDPSLVRPERTRMFSLGVSLSLPTWGFQKEKAGLGQAKAQLEAARDNQANNLLQVDVAVAGAYHGLETALKQLQFTRERLLPQAQMAYRLALTAYSSGGATAFADLLTAQSGLRDTELAQLQAENGAVQAYVALSAAIGADPDQAQASP